MPRRAAHLRPALPDLGAAHPRPRPRPHPPAPPSAILLSLPPSSPSPHAAHPQTPPKPPRQARYQKRTGSEYTIIAAGYGKVHTVKLSHLRPGWRYTAPDPAAAASSAPADPWTYELGGVTHTSSEWAAIFSKAHAGGWRGPPKVGAERVAADLAIAGTSALCAPPVGGPSPAAPTAALPTAVAEEELGEGESESERAAGFKWGVAVEVTSPEEGLKGCWCPAEVLKQAEDGKVLVAWLSETAEPLNLP